MFQLIQVVKSVDLNCSGGLVNRRKQKCWKLIFRRKKLDEECWEQNPWEEMKGNLKIKKDIPIYYGLCFEVYMWKGFKKPGDLI